MVRKRTVGERTGSPLASLETPSRGFLPRFRCGLLPRRPARSRGLRSPREGLRESRESGFLHHVKATWSQPRGERRPFRPIVPGRRRARLCSRRSGSPACGVVAVAVARRREPRRSLFGAWPRERFSIDSRHPSEPDRGRTRDRRGTHPGGDRSPRGERGPSGPSSAKRPASRRSCTSWRRGERRRPSLRWCGRRSGPRLCARADVPRERPGERGQGRRRHHGVSLVTPWRPRRPGSRTLP